MDRCEHGMTPAFCARCAHDTGRIAVMRPRADTPTRERVDPYKLLTTRPVTRVVHSLVPTNDLAGVRAVIARLRLDLTYAITITRRDGSEFAKRISKGRAYRMQDNGERVTLRCPKCEIRMAMDEALIVTPYVIALPRIENCLACAELDDDDRMNCRACDGRGWVVKGQDFVSVDLACSACVAEMRGRSPSYTTPNHTGEPGNPRKGSTVRVGRGGAMCIRCQQRSASNKSRVCSQCASRERELTPIEAKIREISKRIDVLKGRSVGPR